MSFVPGEVGEEEGAPETVKQPTQPGTFSATHCTTLLMDREIFLLNFRSVDDYSPQECFLKSKCFEVMLEKLMLIMLQLKCNCRKEISSSSTLLLVLFCSSSLGLYLLTVFNLNSF